MKTFSDWGIDTRGRTSGEIKALCPKCSAHRRKSRIPCLSVNLDEGLWNCWHCGWRGALKQGEHQPPRIPQTWRRPAFVPRAEPQPAIEQWFAKRGISADTLRRNQVGPARAYFPQTEDERSCIAFPYLRGSEVINVKYRTADKLFRMENGCERVLYGLNDIGETLFWVEGEIDKLSVEEAGITSCVSVPDGAPTPDTRNYATKFDWLDAPELERVQHHVIAVDADAPGQRLAEELSRRLGRERCSVVTWPDGCKDANDVLVTLGPDALLDCLRESRPYPIEGTFTAEDFADDILAMYRDGQRRGESTGWESVDRHYTVLPGEWTLVTGIPGHGKSEWLDALVVNLARLKQWRFAVFSPENQPIASHIVKIAEKYVGAPFEPGPTRRMTEADIDRATTWIGQHFVHLLPDKPTIEGLLDAARQLVRQRGINGLILDPWNEIDHMRPKELTETEYISRTLGAIRQFARQNDVHVWVVAHPTKLQREHGKDTYPVPTPYDVSGSAHWRNKADNCITVWRDVASDTSDVHIHVQKVRKKIVGKVGMIVLRYDRVTGRYVEAQTDAHGRPVRYSMAGVE